MEAFERNWLIKANCFIASEKLQKLDSKKQTEILRILQEALSNIARHSGASEVSLKIIDLASAIKIVIRDNGKGIADTSITSPQKHYGLVNMRERAKNIGGEIEIKNEGGLSIAITIKDTFHR